MTILAWFFLVLVVLLFVLFLQDLWFKKYQRVFPGPDGPPILGMAWTLLTFKIEDLYPYIRKVVNKYGYNQEGNIFKFRTISIMDPVEAEILLNSKNHIDKGYEYFIVRPWLREGLLLSTGNKWHYRRKILTPTFHFKILEDSSKRVANNADLFVQLLLESNGKTIDIEGRVKEATLNTICEAALGIDMTTKTKAKSDYIEAVIQLAKLATRRYMIFYLHSDIIFSLSKTGRLFYKNLAIAHNFSLQIILQRIEERKRSNAYIQNTNGRQAFLDRLIDIHEDNPEKLTVQDIQEEVDTFTFEGHDTTSSAILFSLFLLANHPECQEKAAEEQYNIFGESNRQPNMNDLQKMHYLEMVIKEVLRLYPSVPMMSRKTTKDLQVSSGKIIRLGYNVLIWPYFIHRNVNYWDDPEEFRPERFEPGIQRHPFSYIPFSGGPRNCIGQKFAMMELKMVLSAVLRRCRLEAVTKEVLIKPNVILTPVHPVKMKIFPREKKVYT